MTGLRLGETSAVSGPLELTTLIKETIDVQTEHKRPLRILHVASHNMIRAGGSIQMMRLCLGLKKLGHSVHCIFNIKTGDRPPGLSTFGPLHEAGIGVRSFPMQHLRKFYGMIAFRKFLSANRFDIIHAHRFRALNFVCSATPGMQLPVLIGNKKNSSPVPAAWSRLYGSSRVDAVIVNAQAITDLLEATGQVSAEKIRLIYNGVDLAVFHPGVDGSRVRKEFGISQNSPVFGMIANFARKKAHDVFFEAARLVLQARPDAVFLLAGGKNHTDYKTGITRKGFGSSFIFTGFRNDIPEIIASLDVSVISSSKGEGLTGSLVESMVMGKPVISTDVAGNAEVIRHNETGLLVPQCSPEKMADAMLYLLSHRAEAAKLGAQARASITDKVDNTQRTRRFEGLYYELLEKRGFRKQPAA